MSTSQSSFRRGQRFNTSRSFSSSSSEFPFEICKCELRSPIRVCTTEDNAGRRFFGCHYFPKRCNHFVWIDPELTRRGVEYALQMQAENRALQNQVRQLEKELEAYQNAGRRIGVSPDSAVVGGEYRRILWVLTGSILMSVVLLCLIVLDKYRSG